MNKMVLSKEKSYLGIALIGLASILWGLDGVVLTPRLSNINVVYVVFILHALPFLFMNLFLFKRYREFNKLDKVAKYSLLAVSVFGGIVGTIAIVKALFLVNFQQLSVVVLLQKFQPVFAIILAAIFLKEKLSRHFLFWGIIAIIAGYFLTFGFKTPNLDADANTIKAALLSLVAAFSFGSSTVFSKNILAKVDYITATFFRYGTAFILLLPIIIFSGLYTEITALTSDNWMILIIISLTTGSGAILMYYYGLKYIKASVSTIIELFFPISAILFDYFINHNVLSTVQWISAAVMIFAIIRANMRKK